jgi:hypothetical protein
MARTHIGEVIEIHTALGLSYGLATHHHPDYWTVLRVFATHFSERPTDLTALVTGDIAFTCLFPVGPALARKLVEKVGKVGVPDALKDFPVFRSGQPDRDTHRVKTWWFWDGEREWRVGQISDAQRSMPIRGTWNLDYLVSRIEKGWAPETDPTSRTRDAALTDR